LQFTELVACAQVGIWHLTASFQAARLHAGNLGRIGPGLGTAVMTACGTERKSSSGTPSCRESGELRTKIGGIRSLVARSALDPNRPTPTRAPLRCSICVSAANHICYTDAMSADQRGA